MVWEFFKKLLGKKPEEKKEENPFAEESEDGARTETNKHTPAPISPISARTTSKRGKGGKFVKEKDEVADPDDEMQERFPEKLTELTSEEETELEPILEAPTGKRIGDGEALKVMEAALFMSSKGLSIEEMGNIANLPLLKTRELVSELVDGFNARNRALEIVEDIGGYRMKVRAPYDESVNHLAGGTELSAGEMKTLSFIAYKQPLIQSQLVQVRSNTAYEHLHTLVEKGFISKEPKGRTFILRTTKKFSEYFGAHALKLRPMTMEEKLDSRAKNMNSMGDQSASEELL